MMPEQLEQYFRARKGLARWAGKTWRAWSFQGEGFPSLAIVLPVDVVRGRVDRPLVELLEEKATEFHTPSFRELKAVAGGVDWRNIGERHARIGGRTFNLAALAVALSIVEPRAGAVGVDVVRRITSGLLRIHTSSWVILQANVLTSRAPDLVFDRAGEPRHVA